MKDTSTPFSKLNGATAKITNVERLVIEWFTAVPIATNASIGISNALRIPEAAHMHSEYTRSPS